MLCSSSLLFFRIGTYNVDSSYNAGLDLEMPGNNKWRTIYYVEQCILARRVTAATVKQRAKKVLELVKKCAKGAPEVSTLFVPNLTLKKKNDIQLFIYFILFLDIGR